MQEENRIILLGSNGFIGSAVTKKFKNTKKFSWTFERIFRCIEL